MKTKVEAFEAALSSVGPASTVAGSNKEVTSALPEARVLLRRITNEDYKLAGVIKTPVAPKEKKTKRGTVVSNSSSGEKVPPTDKVGKPRALTFIYINY